MIPKPPALQDAAQLETVHRTVLQRGVAESASSLLALCSAVSRSACRLFESVDPRPLVPDANDQLLADRNGQRKRIKVKMDDFLDSLKIIACPVVIGFLLQCLVSATTLG